MTPDQIELMKTAARSLLAHRDSGRKCDPEAVRWADTLLRNNPQPMAATPAEKGNP